MTSTYDYSARLERPTRLKLPELERNGRLKHVLYAAQFGRSLLDELVGTARQIRVLARHREDNAFLGDLLSHKNAMLYFTQPSTRTFLSFDRACKLLGMTTAEIRDPSLSSEYKGESLVDSMRMFSSYSDLIVVRAGRPMFAEECAYLMNDLDDFNQRSVPIINGGSGADEHPTQALLDMVTIDSAFNGGGGDDSGSIERSRAIADIEPGIRGKTFVFCGDVGRGRTVRSLAVLLAQYDGVKMRFVAPDHPDMRLGQDLRDNLTSRGVEVTEHHRLEDVVDTADLVYMTRVQSEHDSDGQAGDMGRALRESSVVLTDELASRMKPEARIMHPFPRNEEIPVEVDRNPRAMYFAQAANGISARAALIAHLFDVDRLIHAHFAREYGDFHDYNVSVLK